MSACYHGGTLVAGCLASGGWVGRLSLLGSWLVLFLTTPTSLPLILLLLSLTFYDDRTNGCRHIRPARNVHLRTTLITSDRRPTSCVVRPSRPERLCRPNRHENQNQFMIPDS